MSVFANIKVIIVTLTFYSATYGSAKNKQTNKKPIYWFIQCFYWLLHLSLLFLQVALVQEFIRFYLDL
jgi:hypothetical protein